MQHQRTSRPMCLSPMAEMIVMHFCAVLGIVARISLVRFGDDISFLVDSV